MLECKICNKIFKNASSLSTHVHQTHNLTRKEYYDRYEKKENEGKCKSCGEETAFRSNRYLAYCSQICYRSSIEFHENCSKANKDRKQSKETVEKRIKNTDQKAKENKRKETVRQRYQCDNVSQLDSVKEKLSKAHKGSKKTRTKTHQLKIIESKRKNNTLQHSQETKKKISDKLQEIYQSDDPPVTISENNNKRHVHGYYKNFYYRSSYELKFLEYCDKNEILVESAENKKFRVPYIHENKKYFYYPDFYLPEYDYVVEIKPNTMLTNEKVLCKISAGLQAHRLLILDEEYINDLSSFFKEIKDEYIHVGQRPHENSINDGG